MRKKLLVSLRELIEIRKRQSEEINQYKELEEAFRDLENQKKDLLNKIEKSKTAYLNKLQEVASEQKISILGFAYEVIKIRREHRNDTTPIKNLRIVNVGCREVHTMIENSGIFRAFYQPDGRKIHWKYAGQKYTEMRHSQLVSRLETDYNEGVWDGVLMLDIELQSEDDVVNLRVPYVLFEPLRNGLCLIDYLSYVKLGFYPNIDGLKQKDFKLSFDMNFERVPDLHVNLYNDNLNDYCISRMWLLDKDIEEACFKVFGEDV